MMTEDRALTLSGYEVYRFGADDFAQRDEIKAKLIAFFDELLGRHGCLSSPDTATS
jgi:hypothetical protein